MDGTKKRAVLALAVFLAFMAVCTVIAEGIYKSGLARVRVTSPQRQSLSHRVTGTGSVLPGQTYGIYTQPGIRVHTVFLLPGQHITAGDNLLQLDLGDLEEMIQGMESEKALYGARLEDWNRQAEILDREKRLALERLEEDYEGLVKAQDLMLESSQLAWVQKKLAREQAQAQLEQLQEDGTGDQASLRAQVEMLRLEEEQALKAAENAALQREKALKEADRQLEDARAATYRETADRVELERKLSETEEALAGLYALREVEGMLQAPEDGYLLSCHIKTGERTGDGACFLYAAQKTAGVVEVSLGRENAGAISLGDRVELSYKSPAGENKRFQGSISYLEQTDGGVAVRIPLEDAGAVPGQSVNMEYEYTSGPYETVLPVSALYGNGSGGYVVYLVEEREGILGMEERLRKIPVRLLEENGEVAAVSGAALTPESLVVQSADKELAEGDAVRVMGS